MIRAPIQLQDLHTPQGQARLASYLKDIYTKIIPTITGSGAPKVLPTQIGQQYVDITNHQVYVATKVATTGWVMVS
jgi:hypothetical protein